MAKKKISHDDVFEDDIFTFVDEAGKSFNNTIKEIRSNLQSLTKISLDKVKFGDPKSLGDVENTRRASKAIDEYAKANDKLNKVQTDGAKIIAVLNERGRQLAQTNKDNAKLHDLESDSLAAMRIQLKKLQEEYDKLSAAQRGNESIGGKLKNTINSLDKEVKKLEESTGRHRASVGHYEKGLKGLERGLSAVERITGINLDTMREGIKVLGDLVKGLESATKFTKTATVATEENTVATEASTIAEKASTAAKAAGALVIGGVIGGLALLTVGIYSWITASEQQKRVQEDINKLEKESLEILIKSDEARREAAKLSFQNSLQRKIDKGELSDTQAKLEELTREYKIQTKLNELQRQADEADIEKRRKRDKLSSETVFNEQVIAQNNYINRKLALDEKYNAEKEKIDIEQQTNDRKALLEWKQEIIDINVEANEKSIEEAKKAVEKLKKYQEEIRKAKQQLFKDAYAESKEADKIIEATDKKIADQNEKNLEEKSEGLFAWFKRKKKIDEDAKKEEERSEKEHEENLQKLREKRVESYARMTRAIFQGIQEANDKEIKSNEQKISELDRQIQYQQQLALQGETNTLAALEKERAEALAERKRLEEKARKEREAEQLAEVFLEFMKVYAKDGFRASSEATAQTLIAKGVSKIIAGSLYEGQEDIGKASQPLDSKGGRLYVLHDNESVVTGKGTAQTPGLVTAVNEKGFLGAQEWAMKNIPLLEDKSKSEQVTEKLAAMIVSEMAGLRKDIQELPDTDFKRNVVDEIVRIDREKGHTTETTFKKVGTSYSKH